MNQSPNEIEESTATLWLNAGTIRVTGCGSENTYYVDEFGNEFFCKNYPQDIGIFKVSRAEALMIAAEDAEISSLPQTVYNDGRDWRNADSGACFLRLYPVQFATILPCGFFNS